MGRGQGTVAGGRIGLALSPRLLADLAQHRAVALVTGTNGKTTTTGLLAVALEAGGAGPVVTNDTGSNMPAGHVAALVSGAKEHTAVLEVDESYLEQLVQETNPATVLLLNLSRDQLDRTNEVRMLAARWRRALADATSTVVVANADDPLVTYGAGTAPSVQWVAAGMAWRLDATGCPSCDGRITFERSQGGDWWCDCGFRRPEPMAWLHDEGPESFGVFADGRRLPIVLQLPGRFNRANALMAAVAAEAMGVASEQSLAAMALVGQVAGRFTVPVIGGVSTRLMLAKNPAGWAELLTLVSTESSPVVVGINARTADGTDPSWLWDVPFELLSGRPVVATGERCFDLGVRLRHAGIEHDTVLDPGEAVALADAKRRAKDGGDPSESAPVDFIGNYTAFHDLVVEA
jgi:lipid II isoglutaminyl synthase (glutamine-hydrolysing)